MPLPWRTSILRPLGQATPGASDVGPVSQAGRSVHMASGPLSLLCVLADHRDSSVSGPGQGAMWSTCSGYPEASDFSGDIWAHSHSLLQWPLCPQLSSLSTHPLLPAWKAALASRGLLSQCPPLTRAAVHLLQEAILVMEGWPPAASSCPCVSWLLPHHPPQTGPQGRSPRAGSHSHMPGSSGLPAAEVTPQQTQGRGQLRHHIPESRENNLREPGPLCFCFS